MSKPSPATFDSTLANVLSYDFEVSSTTLGQVVAQKFAQNPDLPGVIVTENSHLLGTISRTQFKEKFNNSQQKEFYSSHPIQLLLDYIRIPPLLLPPDCNLIEAVNIALNRNKELIYEPIIVVFSQNKYRLIDIQELLLTQNQVMYQAKLQSEQQQSQIEQSVQLIRAEKKKFKNYLGYYKQQKEKLKKTYEFIFESKQKEWLKAFQEKTTINQEFQRISQLVMAEMSQAFSSILTCTHSINSNNQYLVQVNQSISRDLEIIHSTADQISHFLKQIHHLAVQASIIVHQDQSSSQGYSKINSEMNKTIKEMINCNQKMNQIANQVKFNTQKLQDIAQNNEEINRSIHYKIQRGEMVIHELEQLVIENENHLISLIEISAKNVSSNGSESIKLESELIETSLTSETLTLDSNSETLVHLIEHTLNKKSPSSLA